VARLYRVGIAGWMLCLALGTFPSAGISAGGESELRSSSYSSSQIREAPVQTPIDATMARLARLEHIAGANSAHLSAAGRNLFNLADRWAEIRERLVKGAARPAQSERLAGASPIFQSGLGAGTNLQNSRYSGFTQSETSTAWCGANAVIGFNDSGAEVTTMASGRGVSMDGYALSSDRGMTFTYMGPPATPSDPNTFMAGDPVVACADASSFYYVSAYIDGTNGISAVSLSTSTDGGKTFSMPAVIVSQPSDSHIVDGAWIAAQTGNPAHLYVSYTDLDFSGSISGTDSGSAIPRYAIEIVSSADGGATWSAVPVTVAQVCADSSHPFAFVGGSWVAVGPAGDVYVAWELFGNTDGLTGREIQIARSIDQAQSFPPLPVTVATVTCAGDCVDLQGLVHSNEYPSLAISKEPHGTKVYLAWTDGARQVPDTLTTTGSYNFTDIRFSQSGDAGATWSPPVRVNRDLEGGATPQVDHFESAIATDSTGRIAICFYDRRNDAANFLIDRYCASSKSGNKWTNDRITLTHFPVVVGQDILMAPDYMGDYDTLASDSLGRHSGFLGRFASNTAAHPIVHTTRY